MYACVIFNKLARIECVFCASSDQFELNSFEIGVTEPNKKKKKATKQIMREKENEVVGTQKCPERLTMSSLWL